jgi:hypothetical protein
MFSNGLRNEGLAVKEAVSSNNIWIFFFTSETKPFILPVMEGAPSVHIPMQRSHDNPLPSR